MGITGAVLAATVAASVGSMVMQNQQVQHAKGAAQAQDTAVAAQQKAATDQTKTNQTTQAATAQAGAAQKMAAALASMTQQGGQGGTITGASTAPPAQTGTKMLLGA